MKTYIKVILAVGILAWSNLAFCGEIHDAAKAGDLAKVKALLKDNPDLVSSKTTDKSSYLFGGTPLDYAAMGGHKDMVELLLANKADPNPKDYAISTPLLQAAEFGHKDIVELLLAKKADVNAKSASGWTALHCAAYCGHRDVAVLLLTNGADVNSTNSDGLTPLDFAVQSNTDVMELLIANHAEVNVQDAAGAGDLKKVKALLKGNPDLVFNKIHCGWTALHFAARNGQNEVAEFLLANKADLNVKDCIGQTPLHMAVMSGYKAMVELLLASGADINAKDNNGRTPLHMAKHHNGILISRVIPKGSVIVGADTEAASDKLFQAMADVLLQHGGTE